MSAWPSQEPRTWAVSRSCLMAAWSHQNRDLLFDDGGRSPVQLRLPAALLRPGLRVGDDRTDERRLGLGVGDSVVGVAHLEFALHARVLTRDRGMSPKVVSEQQVAALPLARDGAHVDVNTT